MGLTKQYLRFVPGTVFGVIGNSSGNVLLSKLQNQNSDLIAVGACENVVFWNCRNLQKAFELRGDRYAVTVITQNDQMTCLAAGYFDGSIRVFNLHTRECVVTFSGHRTLVSCLAYDADGSRLASGGLDTEIVVWDVVDQSGVCRLKGHAAPVTQCCFMKQKNVLISCSKDSLVKFWALDSCHCFKTVVQDNREIWDLLLLNDTRMFVGSKESANISVYELSTSSSDEPLSSATLKRERVVEEILDFHVDTELEGIVHCVKYGEIPVHNTTKRMSFAVDKNGRMFGYHTYRKTLNLFKVLKADEITKRIQRAKKKFKKVAKAEGTDLADEEIDIPVDIEHEIEAWKPLTFPANIVSFTCEVDRKDIAKLVLLFKNNDVSLYALNVGEKNSEAVPLAGMSHFGHQSHVRTLTFSFDNLNVLSASDDCLKIWNSNSHNCICTLQCEYALCSSFVPGNKHCLIGTKSGKIQIFDIALSSLLENVDAHNGTVQCMCLSADQRGIVTGSNDKDVKLWNFELVKDENYSSTKKRLTLSLQRTLKMPEEVLCVKCSPDNRLLAISLLDFTVKVVFVDTLKFAFLLYGHHLPVRSMDISFDSRLIVTGSDDRNVKLWSLEFGCCNKSIFAHNESVTCVQFLPNTHMFFSAGKDKKLKQWDGDKFRKILTLEGHQDAIAAITVSSDGTSVVSASRDRSLRVWEKTDEILVLEEEQELEREALMDKALVEEDNPVIVGEYNRDASLANKKTVEATEAVDRLIEAVDVYREETVRMADHEYQCKISKTDLPPLTCHPLFLTVSAESPKHYMSEVLRRIKTKDLEEALLLLPFMYAIQLLEILIELADLKSHTEVTSRCLSFLLHIHYAQLSSSEALQSVVDRLKNTECFELKNLMGFMLTSLKFLETDFEEEPLFIDMTKRKTRKKKKIFSVLSSV